MRKGYPEESGPQKGLIIRCLCLAVEMSIFVKHLFTYFIVSTGWLRHFGFLKIDKQSEKHNLHYRWCLYAYMHDLLRGHKPKTVRNPRVREEDLNYRSIHVGNPMCFYLCTLFDTVSRGIYTLLPAESLQLHGITTYKQVLCFQPCLFTEHTTSSYPSHL